MATTGRRRGLDQDKITQAAVELLDEVGLSAMTTRRLADKLGVRSPTLYWHVRNKAELLDLVAEAICADAFVIDDRLPWRDQLATGMHQFRTLLLSHRDAAELLRDRPPSGPNRLGHIETTMRILTSAGFGDEETAAIAQLLTAHVLNSVSPQPTSAADAAAPPSVETAPDLTNFPTVQRILPVLLRTPEERKFELGVEVILDGLSSRVRHR